MAVSVGRPRPPAPDAGTREVALAFVARAAAEGNVPSVPVRANRVWSSLSPASRRHVRNLFVRICQEIKDDARRRP
jgi:hypothetical protein